MKKTKKHQMGNERLFCAREFVRGIGVGHRNRSWKAKPRGAGFHKVLEDFGR